LAARTERALRNFLQHVVAADGFNEFLFGVLAFLVVVIVMLFVAMCGGGMLVVRRGGVRFAGMRVVLVAIVLGTRRVIGMGGVFARVLLVNMLIVGVLMAMFVFVLGLLGRGSGSRSLDRG
jgi:hypothetical protein